MPFYSKITQPDNGAHMYQIIYESLNRQDKALALLRDLLEEEYQILLGRDTDGVVALEFSIQELIRQLAVEKTFVIDRLNGQRVLDYAAGLENDEAQALQELFQSIDATEQQASRQASRNAQLSLALLDQSTSTLYALTSKATPAKAETYGRRGDMVYELHPGAALISGRL